MSAFRSDPLHEAALAETGHVLVLGGPGSGKTTLGLRKALWAMLTMEEHQRVLFLSFSRAAVGRIMRAAQSPEFADQLRRRVQIDTYHSFFWDIIRSYGGFVGLPGYVRILAPEQAKVIQRSPGGGTSALQALADRGEIDLERLASLTAAVVHNQPAVAHVIGTRYPLVILDEFQDTDGEQYAFVLAMAQVTQLFCLADPDQMIYSFREGVTQVRVQKFREDIAPRFIDLEKQNFRNEKTAIPQYAEAILHGRTPPRVNEVKISRFPYPNHVGLYLKRLVLATENRLHQLSVPFPSIAVLVRTNEGVQTVSEMLEHKTKAASYSLFHATETDSNQLQFAWRMGIALLCTPRHLLAGQILEFMAGFHLCVDQAKPAKLGLQLQRSAEAYGKGQEIDGALARAIDSLCTATCDSGRSGRPDIDLDRITTLLGASEDPTLQAIGRCLVFGRLGHEPYDFDLLSRTQAQYGTYEPAQQKLIDALASHRLRDVYGPRHRRVVTTMHKSKGKEYDAVIIVDLSNPRFGLVDPRHKPPYKEDRRLLRVAITRARHLVHILTSSNKSCPLLESHSSRPGTPDE
ncbi:MAG: ATP-dependent helicase [bacterium]|nr:ATP-dependent helicase [bacterium]